MSGVSLVPIRTQSHRPFRSPSSDGLHLATLQPDTSDKGSLSTLIYLTFGRHLAIEYVRKWLSIRTHLSGILTKLSEAPGSFLRIEDPRFVYIECPAHLWCPSLPTFTGLSTRLQRCSVRLPRSNPYISDNAGSDRALSLLLRWRQLLLPGSSRRFVAPQRFPPVEPHIPRCASPAQIPNPTDKIRLLIELCPPLLPPSARYSRRPLLALAQCIFAPASLRPHHTRAAFICRCVAPPSVRAAVISAATSSLSLPPSCGNCGREQKLECALDALAQMQKKSRKEASTLAKMSM
ncbi:hypothetical protein C8J57DRAFT_1527707 [Mycena rebaudengoi]|nr:hypothetical protein C8J57DRAFT_1527707 [Mycena rebaudengoi]